MPGRVPDVLEAGWIFAGEALEYRANGLVEAGMPAKRRRVRL